MKKWIIIAVVFIVGLLSGYVICCYSQSDSLTDALALYGGKEKFETVDTLRAGNITYNVFLKNDDTDDVCDVLVYRTQKCFGINMKNRYCYYSNYACPRTMWAFSTYCTRTKIIRKRRLFTYIRSIPPRCRKSTANSCIMVWTGAKFIIRTPNSPLSNASIIQMKYRNCIR